VNWEMLGAIAEVVGALTVVATLGYLAVQIRANTAAMRREAEQEGFDGTRATLGQIAVDRDLARVFRTGLAGMENLDPDERVQFGAFLLETTYNWLRMHSFAQDGTVAPGISDSVLRARRDIVVTPGYRQWFDARKHWLPDDFRAALEKDMASQPKDFVPVQGTPPGAMSAEKIP
jgi:hypothetical protein